jgi:polysaccharide export outer membrane protein
MSRNFYLMSSIAIATIVNHTSSVLALPLSAGDRLEVSIPNEKYFSRTYEINQNGELEIPYLGAIKVVGLEPEEAKEKLTYMLVNDGYFPSGTLQLSIQILKWAPILVSVAGEVFQPGRVLINQPDNPKTTFTSPETNQVTGEFQPKRYLTAAIEATGGVLPTANIKQIIFRRNGQEKVIDLTGVFTGEAIEDFPLITGDEIIVPAADHFQASLMRPSLITPAGIKVIVSNLTIPANSNSTSSIGNDEEGIPFSYGARFSHAVIATNCVGGTKATNANRSAILVRTNRLTGETTYFERSVEDLIRNSHNDQDNPYLMPRDGVACYDSRVTNTRDVFRTLFEIINPVSLFKNLFGSN